MKKGDRYIKTAYALDTMTSLLEYSLIQKSLIAHRYLFSFFHLQLGLASSRHATPIPESSSVNGNGLTVDVGTSATGEVDNHAGNVFGSPQPLQRVLCAQLLDAARHVEQPVGHLAGEEAGTDAVDGDVARAKLDGEVAAEVQHGGLARRVAVGALEADGADAQTGHGRRDDDAARVLGRGPRLQQRGEDADGVEDGPDVEVHDLGKGRVRVRVEALAPRRARVGHEDVDLVRVLLHLGEQVLHALELRRVGRHRDGLRPRGEVGQRIERRYGFVARRRLARRDEDF